MRKEGGERTGIDACVEKIDAITHPDNVRAAIRSLHRESTPGVDSMPLDFYIMNLKRIAPQLSELFREQLRRGEISATMRHAVLTPLSL